MTLRILLAAALAVALGAGAMAALLSPRPAPKSASVTAGDALASPLPKGDALPIVRDGSKPIRVIPITKADRMPRLAADPPSVKDPARIPQQQALAPAQEPEHAPLPVPAARGPELTPAAPQAAAEPEEPDPVNHVSRETSRGRHSSGDICSRTGGWRVTLRGGRSWRCAYSRR